MIKKLVLGSMLSAIVLSGCSGGIGRAGSPAWKVSAPDSVQRDYYQGICLDKGYDLGTKKMEACIRGKPRDPNKPATVYSPSTSRSTRTVYLPAPTSQVSTYEDLVCKNGKVMTIYGCRYR